MTGEKMWVYAINITEKFTTTKKDCNTDVLRGLCMTLWGCITLIVCMTLGRRYGGPEDPKRGFRLPP